MTTILGPKTPVTPIQTATNIITESDYKHALQVFVRRNTLPDATLQVVFQDSRQTGETVVLEGVSYPVTDPDGYASQEVWNGSFSDLKSSLTVAVSEGKLTLEEVTTWLRAAIDWDLSFIQLAEDLAQLLDKSGLKKIPQRSVKVVAR